MTVMALIWRGECLHMWTEGHIYFTILQFIFFVHVEANSAMISP